jgi:hypothetical protein
MRNNLDARNTIQQEIGRLRRDASQLYGICVRMHERTYAYARNAQTLRAYKSMTQFIRAQFEIASSEIRFTCERLSPAISNEGYHRINVINTNLFFVIIPSITIIQRHISIIQYQHRRLIYIFSPIHRPIVAATSSRNPLPSDSDDSDSDRSDDDEQQTASADASTKNRQTSKTR